MPELDLGMPWAAKTRQDDGRDTEKRLLKERGAKRHPMSGAGSIKDDGSTHTVGAELLEDEVFEIKDCVKSFRLSAKDLRKSFVNAVRQGKTSVWLIYFTDQNFTAEVRLVPGGAELVEEE